MTNDAKNAEEQKAEGKKAPKNLVVCCDGTGNEYGEENSNVVKLYTCLDVKDIQRAYYHPGVGTMGDPNQTSWWGKQKSKVNGLAFGSGFTANLADAYRFLMGNYADGDRIYLFGFSRGAYTVRALAGALNLFGLLCPGNEGHLPYLLNMYSERSRDAYNKGDVKRLYPDDIANGFRETFSRDVIVHFVGVWDTVSSVGWIYDPVKLLFEGENPSVRKGRHAISVDERRCFFQNNLWGPPLRPEETPRLEQLAVDKDGNKEINVRQDIVQAWFPGVHSDVGGSYKQSESAPAMAALEWIIQEAEDDGLLLNRDKCAAVFGEHSHAHPALTFWNKKSSGRRCLHDSLTGPWWLLEFFPHKYFDQDGQKRWRLTPWPHRRELPDNALISPSLRHYLAQYPKYAPRNLEKDRIADYAKTPVPMPRQETMKRLTDQGFGVYHAPTVAVETSKRPVAIVTGLCLALGGVALWKLMR